MPGNRGRRGTGKPRSKKIKEPGPLLRNPLDPARNLDPSAKASPSHSSALPRKLQALLHRKGGMEKKRGSGGDGSSVKSRRKEGGERKVVEGVIFKSKMRPGESFAHFSRRVNKESLEMQLKRQPQVGAKSDMKRSIAKQASERRREFLRNRKKKSVERKRKNKRSASDALSSSEGEGEGKNTGGHLSRQHGGVAKVARNTISTTVVDKKNRQSQGSIAFGVQAEAPPDLRRFKAKFDQQVVRAVETGRHPDAGTQLDEQLDEQRRTETAMQNLKNAQRALQKTAVVERYRALKRERIMRANRERMEKALERGESLADREDLTTLVL